MSEESWRAHDHEPPLEVVELLAPIDVALPLLVILGVLTTVVLDRDPRLAIAHVQAAQDVSLVVAELDVDRRLRQAGEDDQQANLALLW